MYVYPKRLVKNYTKFKNGDTGGIPINKYSDIF